MASQSQRSIRSSFTTGFGPVLATYIAVAVADVSVRFLFGDVLSLSDIPRWIYALVLVRAYYYAIRLQPCTLPLLPGLLALLPAVGLLAVNWLSFFGARSVNSDRFSYAILFVDLSWQIGITLHIGLLISGYSKFRGGNAISAPHKPPPVQSNDHGNPAEPLRTSPDSEVSLSTDSHSHNEVLQSLLRRAQYADRAANLMMFVMLSIVIVGSVASFGLWFFSRVGRINLIETQRNRLIRLSAGLTELSNGMQTDAFDDEAKGLVKSLISTITKDYGDNTYDEFLKTIASEEQVSWPDLAMSVTVAALTFFLVEAFFRVYKYNRQLGVKLLSRAESLVLICLDPLARAALSTEVISVLKDEGPEFETGPPNPLEEVVKLGEKLATRGKEK